MGYIYNNPKEKDTESKGEDSLNYSTESLGYTSQQDNSEIQIQSACRNAKLKKKKPKLLSGKVDIDIDHLLKYKEV